MKKSEIKFKKTAVITALCCLLMATSCGQANDFTKKTSPDNSSVSETSAAVDGTTPSDSSALDVTSALTENSSHADVTAAEGKSTETQPAADSPQLANDGAAVQTTAAATANDPLTRLPDNTTASETVTSKADSTTTTTSTKADTSEPDVPAGDGQDIILTPGKFKAFDVLPEYGLPDDIDPCSFHSLDEKYMTESCQLRCYNGYYNMQMKIYDAPSTNANEIATVKAFSKVTGYACVHSSSSGYFVYIEYNGRFGWIERYLLTSGDSNIPNVDKFSVADNLYASMPACDYTEYYLLADSLELYSEPSESSEQLATLNEGTGVYFLGDNDPNSDWRFIVIETMQQIGTYGWVRIGDFYTLEDISPLYYEKHGEEFTPQKFVRGGGKPVLYLYPEKPTDVSVKLKLNGCEFYTTYPTYNNGWELTAYPDGSLINKADGCGYDYLFWDTVDKNHYTFPDGFCVKGEDTEKFLRKTLKQIGLNEREMNEFIVYWLPQMEHNPYNVIRFQSIEYEKTTKLTISPKPDSLLRVFMTYYSVDNPQYIIPQEIKTFERKGFTAVEWGGEKLVGLW